MTCGDAVRGPQPVRRLALHPRDRARRRRAAATRSARAAMVYGAGQPGPLPTRSTPPPPNSSTTPQPGSRHSAATHGVGASRCATSPCSTASPACRTAPTSATSRPPTCSERRATGRPRRTPASGWPRSTGRRLTFRRGRRRCLRPTHSGRSRNIGQPAQGPGRRHCIPAGETRTSGRKSPRRPATPVPAAYDAAW